MIETLWQINHLMLSGARRPRLSDVTLQISHGVTAIIGFSGAGKTSLLNVLSGMISPDRGTLSFTSPSNDEFPFSMPLFWVPQDCGLWPNCTVRQHLEMASGLETRGTADEPQSQADKILSQFDLLERSNAFPGELSKGEQSRLSVARCLAADPAVMLMDEPLSHTDPVRRPGYWKIIHEHIQRRKSSLIFSTHEPAAALRLSSSVICVKEGKVIYDGRTDQLYQNPSDAVSGAFLGPLNEFTDQDYAVWFSEEPAGESVTLIRPERLSVQKTMKGSIQVLHSVCVGSIRETELLNTQLNCSRQIKHLSDSTLLVAGDLVTLKHMNP